MTRRTMAGCRAIVTGASSGIGTCAGAGAVARLQGKVIATARREDRLVALAREADPLAGEVKIVGRRYYTGGHASWRSSPAATGELGRTRTLLVNNAGSRSDSRLRAVRIESSCGRSWN